MATANLLNNNLNNYTSANIEGKLRIRIVQEISKTKMVRILCGLCRSFDMSLVNVTFSL